MKLSNNEGNLAHLWAVGGKKSKHLREDERRYYYKYCPECGWRLTGKFSTCPRCGADLRMKTCDYCGGIIPSSALTCPRCNAPLY